MMAVNWYIIKCGLEIKRRNIKCLLYLGQLEDPLKPLCVDVSVLKK